MNKFERFYEKTKFELRVLKAFADREVDTTYRAHVLLELHAALERREYMTRQELKEAIWIENNSQLTTSVLNPLIKGGYIEVSRGEKTSFLLASLGEGVVEDVMEALGF